MTDDELIVALDAEGLSASVIARKMECPVIHVLQTVRKHGNKGVRHVPHNLEHVRLAMGSEAFTSVDLAGALCIENSNALGRLKLMEKKGQVRRVGSKPCKGGRTVIWMIERG